MKPRLATVTTVKYAGPVLKTFIEYHLRLGFERLFLFFDDPDDPDLAWARKYKEVKAIPTDQRLQRLWRQTSAWTDPQIAPSIDEIMSRQIANAEIALRFATHHGFDWLLHIDADELFYPTAGDAQSFFAEQTDPSVGAIRFWNHEAVPESVDLKDFFRESTLFKRNPSLLANEALRNAEELLAKLEQIPDKFFHYYLNGKSALRLGEGGLPCGVHQFMPALGRVEQVCNAGACILHYPACGFDAFWRKYRAHGAFKDQWWGEISIAESIGRTHLDARDIFARGEEEAARAFYHARFVIDQPEVVQELIDRGLCLRVDPFHYQI